MKWPRTRKTLWNALNVEKNLTLQIDSEHISKLKYIANYLRLFVARWRRSSRSNLHHRARRMSNSAKPSTKKSRTSAVSSKICAKQKLNWRTLKRRQRLKLMRPQPRLSGKPRGTWTKNWKKRLVSALRRRTQKRNSKTRSFRNNLIGKIRKLRNLKLRGPRVMGNSKERFLNWRLKRLWTNYSRETRSVK